MTMCEIRQPIARYPVTGDWRWMTYAVLLLLAGCTTIPADLGQSDVDALVGERGIPVEAEAVTNGESLVVSLTSRPLSAESAVRIALVNNSKLKASYARLGFAAADVYASGRIRNPVLSAAILDSNRSGEQDQLTFGLVTSVTDFLTLKARKRLAAAEFHRVKQSIGAEVLAVAVDAEDAYYRYVAGKQVSALRQQIAKASELSAALAGRYHDAGNMTPRDLALEKAAAAEARLAALGAEAETLRLRVHLANVLGLSVAGAWDAPARLPLPLECDDDLDELLELALESRLDLAAARAHADMLADRLGVTNRTRWLGELELGVERERETDGAVLTGPTIAWDIPVFTQRRDEILRIDAELQIAIADLRHMLVDVENSVRLAHAATGNARARVDEYRQRLIPARMAAVDRAQEEENFMLIGIFEVLTAKQQEYAAYQGYLETVRDYWLSRVELMRAVGNTLPGSANIGGRELDVEAYLHPQVGSGHAGHGAGMASGSHSEHTLQVHPDSIKERDQADMPPDMHHDHNRQQGAGGGVR